MHIFRSLCVGVVFVGLAFVGAAAMPGCGDEGTQTGAQVKTDPAEDAKRAEMIKEMYKTNPPSGKTGGPAGKK